MAPLTLSIPSTTLSSDSKPHTIYNLRISTPSTLRAREVQKRYNDFVSLHSALTSEAGTSPPAPLPPKSWFSRTVGNPALTEERRKGLERYCRSIEAGRLVEEEAEEITSECSNEQWRRTHAWRDFLALDAASPAVARPGDWGATARGSVGALGPSTPITDPGTWLSVHSDMKSTLHTARQHLSRRENAPSPSAQHEASADAKKCLVRAGALLSGLDDGLRYLSEPGPEKLGDGEIRRRRDLLTNARKERDSLDALLNALAIKSAVAAANTASSSDASENPEKEGLFRGANMNGSHAGRRVLGGPAKETSQTRELDNEGLLQLQRQIIHEQDEDVQTLGKVVGRLKDMGIQINDELAFHNELLKQMDQDVDRVGSKVDIAKKRIRKIN